MITYALICVIFQPFKNAKKDNVKRREKEEKERKAKEKAVSFCFSLFFYLILLLLFQKYISF